MGRKSPTVLLKKSKMWYLSVFSPLHFISVHSLTFKASGISEIQGICWGWGSTGYHWGCPTVKGSFEGCSQGAVSLSTSTVNQICICLWWWDLGWERSGCRFSKMYVCWKFGPNWPIVNVLEWCVGVGKWKDHTCLQNYCFSDHGKKIILKLIKVAD